MSLSDQAKAQAPIQVWRRTTAESIAYWQKHREAVRSAEDFVRSLEKAIQDGVEVVVVKPQVLLEHFKAVCNVR